MYTYIYIHTYIHTHTYAYAYNLNARTYIFVRYKMTNVHELPPEARLFIWFPEEDQHTRGPNSNLFASKSCCHRYHSREPRALLPLDLAVPLPVGPLQHAEHGQLAEVLREGGRRQEGVEGLGGTSAPGLQPRVGSSCTSHRRGELSWHTSLSQPDLTATGD